jgi:GDP-L-fucose synthase
MLDLKDKKIVVTGGTGFLGSWVVRKLRERGVAREAIFIPQAEEFDLRIWENCVHIVKGQEVVIHLAALVGGIGANKDYPGKFLYENTMMGLQLMEASRHAGIEKFFSVGTICEYPKITPVPFKEEGIWDGPVDEITGPYGLAKRMLLAQGQAYRKEYGFNAIHLLPTNLYGPGDNFNPESSHVIPALIKKVIDAKRENIGYIEVWGSGGATREFLYVEDATEGIVLALEQYDKGDPVNLGSGNEISIKEVVRLICEIADFKGKIRWDVSKPEGQPRRSLDVSRAEKEFGFRAKMDMREGLKKTINWYESQL